MAASFVALQSSRVQTWLAQKASQSLSSELGVPVNIRNVQIRFFDRAKLQGLYLEDLHHDTLLYVEEMRVNLDDIFLGFTHFSFDEVKLKNGQFNVRQFQGEDDLNIQFLIDYINGPRDTTDTVRSKPPEIFFWKLDLDNIDFTYEYRDSIPDTGTGFNQDLIRINNINASLKRFMLIDDSLSGELRNLQCHDPNGLVVRKMDADFIISYTMMDFAALNLETPLSKLEGKIHFDYNSYDDLSDFIPLVQMRGRIKESKIHTRDLAFFSSELGGLDQVFSLSGNFKGTVDDLTGKNILLNTGKYTAFSGNFRMKGLPQTDSTRFNFNIRNFSTATADLARLPAYPFNAGQKIEIPDALNRIERISFEGELEGMLSDLRLNGRLTGKPGALQADLSLKYNPTEKLYAYKGKFRSEGLNTGVIFGLEKSLAQAVFNIELEGQGFDTKTLQAKWLGEIASLSLNGYPYQQIRVDGTAEKGTFNGQLKVNDPNLKAECSFSAQTALKTPAYHGHLSVGLVDPGALGLWKTDSAMIISAELMADFSGTHPDNLTGSAEISESLFRYGKSRYRLDDFLLEASGNAEDRKIELFSDILDAKVSGAFSVNEIAPAFADVLNKVLPNWFDIPLKSRPNSPQRFNAHLELKDTRLLSALFIPELELRPGSAFQADFSSSGQTMRLKGNIPVLETGGLIFSGIDMNIDAQGSALKAGFAARTLQLTDSLKVTCLKSEISGNDTRATVNFQWASDNKRNQPNARLNFGLEFQNQMLLLELMPSLILVQDTLWQVNEGNQVIFDSSAITFDNLSFSHLDEFIRFDGRISHKATDELDVILDQFCLTNINPLLQSTGITLGGKANGIISLAGIRDDPYFKSNLKFSGIRLNNDLLGDGQLSSIWIPADKRIELDGSLIAGNVPRLSFKGGYYPQREQNNFDIDIMLTNLRVDLFENYLTDIFSDVADGFADGRIHLSGSPEEPVTEGKVLLKRTAFTIGLLNTTYSFTHEFSIEKNQITAKNIRLNDQQGNSAQVNFTLRHKNFNDLKFDVSLQTKRIQALNTNELQSDLFYGSAFASGTFRAYGPLDNIVMDISARTEKGTRFYLPLYDAADISTQDFITFEKAGTISKKLDKRIRVVNDKGYELNFNLNISNDADVVLIFDPQTGDMIQGKGTADLRLEVTESGVFNMYGDYTITSGNYQFNLVVSKPFDLQPGGTISFKGDPYDADINLTALYKVRTSLYNLVKNIDSSANVKRMIDVNAMMNLTDKLMKPQVKFDIMLPNADESTRNLLRSQIPSDDELNRQVFALIMLGNFWPNQGGANEIAGLGGANASELISGQLSNMLGRLSDDLKLGVNYKQRDAASAEELRLMWSTQLMGDRVMIDGNFGTAGIPQSAVQNTSNLVGEFTIEAKMNRDGTVRVKVFNRSNQYLLVFNGVPYTQGVGLFYRRDFELLSDLKKKSK